MTQVEEYQIEYSLNTFYRLEKIVEQKTLIQKFSHLSVYTGTFTKKR